MYFEGLLQLYHEIRVAILHDIYKKANSSILKPSSTALLKRKGPFKRPSPIRVGNLAGKWLSRRVKRRDSRQEGKMVADFCLRWTLGYERGETTIVIHKRWYHLWRLGSLLVGPACLMAWLFGRLHVSTGGRETIYYFR